MNFIYFKIHEIIIFFKHRHNSPLGFLGWVGRVPPGLPPGTQINSAEPPIRGKDYNEVRNWSLELKHDRKGFVQLVHNKQCS